MRGDIPSLPQYAFAAWCSVKPLGQLYLLPTYSSCIVNNKLHVTMEHRSKMVKGKVVTTELYLNVFNFLYIFGLA